ncbi:MAG: hydantoinase B/oxoprolinase family protein, partial [Chloroflexi bacterium]|nr:hydantoinase B/oxoprolinase family protein [Chloroflexota bacterium]
LSTLGNREQFGPPGIFGGETGQLARLSLNDGTEGERHLGTTATNAPVGPGDVLTFRTNGGGGFGDPLERPPERVLEDIQDGYATPAGAREQYGVVVKEIDRRRVHYEIDREATAELRAALRAARG